MFEYFEILRLLKKYKYPPEEEQNAMDIVLKQCEQWADSETDDNEDYTPTYTMKPIFTVDSTHAMAAEDTTSYN